MTSNHHALMTWATHVLQWTVQRVARPRGGANLIKPFSVRIVGRLAYMKLESLIADQHAAVNTFPALYTPPVTPREFVTPEVGGVTFGASRLRWDR